MRWLSIAGERESNGLGDAQARGVAGGLRRRGASSLRHSQEPERLPLG